jgi:hypothetical protein
MEMHIGKKIQARAKELRIGPSELGNLVNTSRQNMVSIYKRESIDALMLWKLSKALKYNFFTYYPLPEIETKELTELKQEVKDFRKENQVLKKELQQLGEKVGMLEKINALLESKHNKKRK